MYTLMMYAGVMCATNIRYINVRYGNARYSDVGLRHSGYNNDPTTAVPLCDARYYNNYYCTRR